jgi:hypothetical protein
MSLIRDYNGDSNIYGLKGHSTFMSVCKFRSFMKRNLRSSHTNNFSRKLLLPTRPSATKHSPNTGFPIGDILHNKEAIERIAKWACELGAHDIEFRPRTTIKTQALVDFVSK